MCKVIDIRSIKSGEYTNDIEVTHGKPKKMFPREVSIHGETYDISIATDYTFYIEDRQTGKIHSLKSVISKYDTDDVAKLQNNTLWINGTNRLITPDYFNSFSIYTEFHRGRTGMDEDMLELMEDINELDGEGLFGPSLTKSLIFEANIIYGAMAYLRFAINLTMDFNRKEKIDGSPCYTIYLGNATQSPFVNCSGYLYLLTDYPFSFVLDKKYDPVIDSNSGLSGIKCYFNLSPQSFEDLSLVDYEERL